MVVLKFPLYCKYVVAHFCLYRSSGYSWSLPLGHK